MLLIILHLLMRALLTFNVFRVGQNLFHFWNWAEFQWSNRVTIVTWNACISQQKLFVHCQDGIPIHALVSRNDKNNQNITWNTWPICWLCKNVFLLPECLSWPVKGSHLIPDPTIILENETFNTIFVHFWSRALTNCFLALKLNFKLSGWKCSTIFPGHPYCIKKQQSFFFGFRDFVSVVVLFTFI